MMNIEELELDLKGQRIHHYSSWGGSHETMTVDRVEPADCGVVIIGTDDFGKPCTMSMTMEQVEELIRNEKGITEEREIDHCNVVDAYTLLPDAAAVIRRELDCAKADMKALKERIKKLQKAYEDALVSDVRIGVRRKTFTN